MAVLVVLVQQREVRSLAPVETPIALFGTDDLDRGGIERSGLHEDFVAQRRFDVPITAVERLRPN